jgi:4-amino-4-deoxy-L-arabinose transferase-like glycosyltransferase
MAAGSDRLRAWLVPVGLAVLAAALRLPNLATRGTWDSDQGHDMLVLRSFVRDGVVPLLGPPTSIGDVHHGALYYYLLAPAAALTGGDSPLAVVLEIALVGVAAVVVTWWLARSIAGPVAGLVAGLAMAISPASVDEATFIWNPNLIGLSSAVALAAAWRAWTTRRPAWWLVAAVGTAVTMQCHVLGVTLLPVVGALLVADLRRRGGAEERRAIIRVGLAGLGLLALSFVPLAIHELTTNFAEVQAALVYLRAGGEPSDEGPVGRFLLIEARVVSWPLVGLIVDGILAAMLALVVVIAIAAWRSIAGHGDERTAARWLGLGLLWTALALTLAAPGLAVIVRGLPNDHYHAFADPMVFTLVGLGAAALWRAGAGAGGGAESRAGAVGLVVTPGRVLAAAGVVTIVAWAVLHQPPAVHPDGGYPAAERAAQRIEASAGPGPMRLLSLPDFKPPDAYAYPMVRDGRTEEGGRAGVGEATLIRADASPTDAASLVVICDALFETAIGAPCGGPAEATVVPAAAGEPVDRFEAAPGRFISVYRVKAP